MNIVWMAAGLAALALLVACIVIFIRNDRMPSSYQYAPHSIIVSNAVNVNTQVFGRGHGAFFVGSTGDLETTLMSKDLAAKLWRVTLTDVETGEAHSFSFHKCLYIGRKEYVDDGGAHFVIASDPLVSKNHCVLYPHGGKLAIRDLGSKNHTFINDAQVSECYLKQGDCMRVGASSFVIMFQALSIS